MRALPGALIVALATAASHAQSADRAADEAAIRGVIQAFLDTREANDAAALGSLLTADVDQQQTSGNTRRGREAVVSGSLATQQSTGGKRTITVDSPGINAYADGEFACPLPAEVSAVPGALKVLRPAD